MTKEKDSNMFRSGKNLGAMLVAGAMIFGGAVMAGAQTEVQGPITVGPALTDFGGAFTFNKFNPALGTLTSVTVDLGLAFSTTITVTNSSLTDASSGTVRTEVQAGVTDTGTFSTPVQVLTITGGNTNVLDDALSPKQAYSLAAGGSTTLALVNGSDNENGVFTSGTVLSEFTGAGTISMPYLTFTTTSLTNTGGNTTASQSTTATLTGTLTYNYQLPSGSTPEPGSAAFLAAGLLGSLGFVARRRRK